VPGATWSEAPPSTQFLRDARIESFVDTGGKGCTWWSDRSRHDWEEAESFAGGVADLIVQADPAHYTANMAKAARKGKIFLDYLRNARGATAILLTRPGHGSEHPSPRRSPGRN